MLHSVGNTHTDWIYEYLSVKIKHLKNLFVYLQKEKIETYFIKDLYENNFVVPQNGICLTFDDGYVDNWVYLFPLLKKYNIKATIFVNPEFVDPRSIQRKQYSAELSIDEQDKALGFLSWNEMIEMEKSGLVDIQSHSMSHTWYFSSPDIIDFFSPTVLQKKQGKERQYPWISWNEKPEQKAYTLNSFAFRSTRYGLPILENGRSLGVKRYFPDKEIEEAMVDFAKNNIEIFNNGWYNILRNKYEELVSGKSQTGRFETEKEQAERYWYELNESKKKLEKRLNKEITILCWPGGAYNDLSVRISEDANYLASTIYSLDKNVYDNINKKYKRIYRESMSGNINLRKKGMATSNIDNFLIYKFLKKNIFSECQT